MTRDDAIKVLRIMVTADSNWRGIYQRDPFELFAEAFPEHAGAVKSVTSIAGNLWMEARRNMEETEGEEPLPIWQITLSEPP